MAATSKGLAPSERDTLFRTLQGLIQNGVVPLEDLNTLVAELNQQTKSDASDMAAFHDSHLSDIFAAADFGDFSAEDGSDDLFAGDGSEWPDESENPFPDDFIAVEGRSNEVDAAFGFQDHSEKSHSSRQGKSGQSRGRKGGDTGAALNARGRSRNTRSKPSSSKKAAEDVLSSDWEPFDIHATAFHPPNSSASTPTSRRKSHSKAEGVTQPARKRDATKEDDKRDARVKDSLENSRCRTSSSQRKGTVGDLDTATRTPTQTREKTRSLSQKKRDGDRSKNSREEHDAKNLDAVLAHMLSTTTSSESKATLSEDKKSPRRKVVKKVAAGIRADDVSTILKAIESGMLETNSAGKIVVRMGKQKKRPEEGRKGASLSRVLDSQKLTNGSTENRSISSAPVQATERLPGAGPPSSTLRRRSRSRKSRPEATEEEARGHERSKSQGRRHESVSHSY